MKINKRVLAIILCFALIISAHDSVASRASVESQKTYETKLDKFMDTLSRKNPSEMVKSMKGLSPKTLNSIIKRCKTRYEGISTDHFSTSQKGNNARVNSANTRSLLQSNLQTAWIAAALIAYDSGYPLSATLVINSVLNQNYTEYNGLFSSVIPSSPSFINTLHAFRSSGLPSQVGYQQLSFPRYEIEDLYFSIHNVTSADFYRYYNSVSVHLYDVYDFDLSCGNSLFVNLVNDWAW
ncbi:MAG: hypothetical protein J5739_06710, partial [Lachnospiraceae bacterium]|nr:hypothetical protein [Lachnospiraceae bacterium]